MSSFDNIKINTPGGTLYSSNPTSTSSTGGVSSANIVATADTANACETCLNSILITNLGNGHPLYQGKGTYNVFNFRTITAGDGCTITHNDKTITVGIDTSGISGLGSTTLAGLTDVSVGTPSKGQVLTWNGSKWDAETVSSGGSGATSLSELTDVSVTSPSKGQSLVWNGSKWDAETVEVSTSLSKLTDVSVGTPTKGQSLVWNGTAWDAETVSSGTAAPTELSSLTDVSVTSPSKGQVLTWNGSKWDAETPETGGNATIPTGLTPMYIFHLPIVVAAGVAGVTGVGTLPEGWTATVTDPSTKQYNITITHNTGLSPISFTSVVANVLNPAVSNCIILGTNMITTAYITYTPGSSTFVINSASATNVKISPSPTETQTALLQIMMA